MILNDRAKSEAGSILSSIVGLTDRLPKKALEPIVIEAILRHRFLRDVAELRLREYRAAAPEEEIQSTAKLAYIRSMIECHTQQACLSTLLDILGYVPDLTIEQE